MPSSTHWASFASTGAQFLRDVLDFGTGTAQQARFGSDNDCGSPHRNDRRVRSRCLLRHQHTQIIQPEML
jgi:hypothetical protein